MQQIRNQIRTALLYKLQQNVAPVLNQVPHHEDEP